MLQRERDKSRTSDQVMSIVFSIGFELSAVITQVFKRKQTGPVHACMCVNAHGHNYVATGSSKAGV